MKKKLKLKKEVEQKLIIVLGIAIITVLAIISNVETEKAVNQCVDAGNSYTYCLNGLR